MKTRNFAAGERKKERKDEVTKKLNKDRKKSVKIIFNGALIKEVEWECCSVLFREIVQ